MEPSLDTLLQKYRQGALEKKELETRIFIRISGSAKRFSFNGMDQDTFNDFISWLYPRISRAIDRYREQGSTFDAYMNTMVKLSAREYCFRQKDRRIIEKAWWDAKAGELMCAEEEPAYFESKMDFKEVRNPKQVLVLLLKSYHYLSDDYLSRAAPAIGMDKDKLKNMVDTLRNQRMRQEEAIQTFKERLYTQFYRCLAFEKRVHAFPQGSSHRQKMKTSLEKAKKRLQTMRKRLSNMRFEAPNWLIANVIGVPKGTIDSNLYAVKRRCAGKERNKSLSGNETDDGKIPKKALIYSRLNEPLRPEGPSGRIS